MKPGYKQTEVGVIPEEWEVKRLGEVATIATGNTPPTSDCSNYGDEFLFVGPVDMGDAKSIGKTEKMLSKKGFAMSRRFPKDSILFVSIGSTIGKCGIAPVELTSNQQINAIFPSSSFSADYLFYAVSAAAPRIKAQAGEQAVPIVNKTQFSETAAAFPPLPEQRAIATALSDVDGLLGGLDRLIAKKRDLKQAAMQQLLTGQTRLPGFHAEWEVKRLHEVCQKIQDGTHFSPKLGGNDYLYVTSKNIRFGMLDMSTAERISAAEHFKIYARCDVKKGDLLLTKDGANTGNAALNPMDEPFSLLSSVAMLRFDSRKHSAAYFMYQILSDFGQMQIKDAMSGNAITRLTLQKIRALRFSVASLPEQAAIAEVLTEMDGELAALTQRREKTRALKQAMMQELLTGRIRLMASSGATE